MPANTEFSAFHPGGICRCEIQDWPDAELHIAPHWFWESGKWRKAGWTINCFDRFTLRPWAVRSFRHGQGGKRFSDWPLD